MTNEEINSQIESYKKKIANPSLPESAKNAFKKKIEALESQKQEIREEKAEEKKDEKSEEKEAKKEKAAKPKKEKKGKKAKKEKAAKAPKDKDRPEFKLDGKKPSEETIRYCEQIVAKWRDRKEKAKKSGGKKKTEPVMVKVTSRVAQVTKDAIKSVSDATIKKNPEKVIAKFEHLQDAAEKFIKSFKEVLGDKYDSAKLQKEFIDPLTEYIDKLKDKFVD